MSFASMICSFSPPEGTATDLRLMPLDFACRVNSKSIANMICTFLPPGGTTMGMRLMPLHLACQGTPRSIASMICSFLPPRGAAMGLRVLPLDFACRVTPRSIASIIYTFLPSWGTTMGLRLMPFIGFGISRYPKIHCQHDLLFFATRGCCYGHEIDAIGFSMSIYLRSIVTIICTFWAPGGSATSLRFAPLDLACRVTP